MQTQLKIFTGIMFLFTILCSCEKTIDFDGDDINSKIVVNGLLLPNTNVAASIVKSNSLLSDKEYFEALTNATAKLYVDNVFVETLKFESKVDTFIQYLQYDIENKFPYDRGMYTGETTVESGKTYRLEVTSDNLNPVVCETTVPMPVQILSIDTVSEIQTAYWGEYTLITNKVKFKDPSNDTNFYRLQLNSTSGNVMAYYNDFGETIYSDTIIIQESFGESADITDPIFKNNENEANEIVMGTPDNQYAIFDDSQINGKEYSIETHYGYDTIMSNLFAKQGCFRTQQFKLYSLSKEYFDYLNTANYHFWFSDDYFSEPVPVYSNVVGGLGIWGSAGVSHKEITIGTYPIDGKTYIDAEEYYQNGYSGY